MTDKYRPESITNFCNAIDFKFKNKDDLLTIFDVGSLHCLESIEFSKIYKKAKIYAFEANIDSYNVCLKNTEKIDNIIVTNKCVNEYDGTCSFYKIDTNRTITPWFDGNRGASSMFKSSGAADHIEKYVQDEIKVPCMRLDTFCKENNITSIDAIWMDLQGAELLAIKSLGKILDTVKVIQTELEINPMYENQCLYNEVNEYLKDKGFKQISGNTSAIFGSDFLYIRD
jgi:FkbM family methyltransferase